MKKPESFLQFTIYNFYVKIRAPNHHKHLNAASILNENTKKKLFKESKLIETVTVHRRGGEGRISSLDEQSVEARLSRGGNQSVLEAAVEAVAAARVNHRRINTEMGRVHAIPRPASPAFIVRVSTHPRGPLRTRHLDIYDANIAPTARKLFHHHVG